MPRHVPSTAQERTECADEGEGLDGIGRYRTVLDSYRTKGKQRVRSVQTG